MPEGTEAVRASRRNTDKGAILQVPRLPRQEQCASGWQRLDCTLRVLQIICYLASQTLDCQRHVIINLADNVAISKAKKLRLSDESQIRPSRIVMNSLHHVNVVSKAMVCEGLLKRVVRKFNSEPALS